MYFQYFARKDNARLDAIFCTKRCKLMELFTPSVLLICDVRTLKRRQTNRTQGKDASFANGRATYRYCIHIARKNINCMLAESLIWKIVYHFFLIRVESYISFFHSVILLHEKLKSKEIVIKSFRGFVLITKHRDPSVVDWACG